MLSPALVDNKICATQRGRDFEGLKKKFRPFGSQFGLKIRRGGGGGKPPRAPPRDPPLQSTSSVLILANIFQIWSPLVKLYKAI